ncbi:MULTISPECIES: RHS repeat-associated core domain-containing protein [Pseudomonas]|jgi:RHS repeat-associated protein|uniref:RHS repeat-associated core domain-containing protein n=1 Tax=Pseudomonas TaxID=286 RepID=UPI0032E4D542
MTVQQATLLCRYHYDPLDRVANCAPLNQSGIQRFYRKNRLATEIQGQVQHSMLEREEQPLAQQQRQAGRIDSVLLATDLQRSVLYSLSLGQHQRPVYSPYGHRSPEGGLISLLGFNGERRDPVTGHYLLGNGYRAFDPVLMRFNSPDSLSPFGKGGVNAYAYCLGDPVNKVDPLGEFALFARTIHRLVSVSISAGQHAGKSLRVWSKGSINGFSKTPPRPGHGPLSPIESGRAGVSKAVTSNPSSITKEAAARAGELNLYEAGAAFRLAKNKVTPQLSRQMKNQKYLETNNLPDHMQYKMPQEHSKNLDRFQWADQNLKKVVTGQTLKSPGELMSTYRFVEIIRQA